MEHYTTIEVEHEKIIEFAELAPLVKPYTRHNNASLLDLAAFIHVYDRLIVDAHKRGLRLENLYLRVDSDALAGGMVFSIILEHGLLTIGIFEMPRISSPIAEILV